MKTLKTLPGYATAVLGQEVVGGFRVCAKKPKCFINLFKNNFYYTSGAYQRDLGSINECFEHAVPWERGKGGLCPGRKF